MEQNEGFPGADNSSAASPKVWEGPNILNLSEQ